MNPPNGRSKLFLYAALIGSVVLNGVLLLVLSTTREEPANQPASPTNQTTTADRNTEVSNLRSSISEVRSALRRFQPANRRSALHAKGYRAVPPEYLQLLLATTEDYSLSDGETENLNGHRGVTDGLGGLNVQIARFLRLRDEEWRKIHEKVRAISLELKQRSLDHHKSFHGPDGRLIHRVPADVARSQDLHDELTTFVREIIGEERTALFVELLPHDRYLTFDEGTVEISLDPETRQKSLVTIGPNGSRSHRLINFTIDDRYKPLIAKEYWKPVKNGAP